MGINDELYRIARSVVAFGAAKKCLVVWRDVIILIKIPLSGPSCLIRKGAKLESRQILRPVPVIPPPGLYLRRSIYLTLSMP
jgi:hypothetical protein